MKLTRIVALSLALFATHAIASNLVDASGNAVTSEGGKAVGTETVGSVAIDTSVAPATASLPRGHMEKKAHPHKAKPKAKAAAKPVAKKEKSAEAK